MAFPSKKGDLPTFSDGFPFWFSYIKSLSDLMINMHGYTASTHRFWVHKNPESADYMASFHWKNSLLMHSVRHAKCSKEHSDFHPQIHNAWNSVANLGKSHSTCLCESILSTYTICVQLVAQKKGVSIVTGGSPIAVYFFVRVNPTLIAGWFGWFWGSPILGHLHIYIFHLVI